MRVGLLCGTKKVDLDLPDSVEVLEMREMAAHVPGSAGSHHGFESQKNP
jgi:hypothetical protein